MIQSGFDVKIKKNLLCTTAVSRRRQYEFPRKWLYQNLLFKKNMLNFKTDQTLDYLYVKLMLILNQKVEISNNFYNFDMFCL